MKYKNLLFIYLDIYLCIYVYIYIYTSRIINYRTVFIIIKFTLLYIIKTKNFNI